MSLIICSNEIPGSGVRSSEFQAPFSFHNHLEQPLRIPPESEVAVQSLKINKEGSISISPNTVWYEYFGIEPTAANKQQRTSTAHYVDLNIDGPREATVDTCARDFISPALNRGVPNPETFGLAAAVPKRDAGGNDFEGWDMTFQQRANASGLNNRPTTYVNKFGTSGTNGGLSFNSASHTLTATGKTGSARALNQAIGTTSPLALNNGVFQVDLTGLKQDGTNVSWGVGLTRCQTTAGAVNKLYNSTTTENFFPEIECDFLVGGFQDPGTTSNRYLYGYHLVEESDDPQYEAEKPLSMKKIDYLDNGDFPNASGFYNWSTNDANQQLSKLKYTVDNENVKVEVFSAASGKWGTLIDTSGANATKNKRFKPLCDTCRNLYPFIFIQGKPAGSQPFITIDNWAGRSISGFLYGSPLNDWWGYLASVNLQQTLGKAIDTREYNQFDAATIGTDHTFKGINASGLFEDYVYRLIVAEAVDFESANANAALFLGYKDQTEVSPSSVSASGITQFLSEDAPELKSTTNIFVRLNNYNVKSYNAGQSAASKIIYAAPRFSTGTAESTGALFFESPERVYIDLNNPNELISNMFDISIVNEDNTLATDLRGKTVVVLHIKQKKVIK
tara:strand:- start:157 stop:2013 length:1857 start_codon:yes stop_codon:yes gene_type:complete